MATTVYLLHSGKFLQREIFAAGNFCVSLVTSIANPQDKFIIIYACEMCALLDQPQSEISPLQKFSLYSVRIKVTYIRSISLEVFASRKIN